MITYDDFKKVEIKIGKILSAEKVEGADKLIRLEVDLAESEPRQIISGIALYFEDIQEGQGMPALGSTVEEYGARLVGMALMGHGGMAHYRVIEMHRANISIG